jgi:RNA polymerase sigma-70 factor (ECF subfamily)
VIGDVTAATAMPPPATALVVAAKTSRIRAGRFMSTSGGLGTAVRCTSITDPSVLSARKCSSLGSAFPQRNALECVPRGSSVNTGDLASDGAEVDVPSQELTALAVAISRGDLTAREALIKVVRPAVLRYVLARQVAEHDAQDLAQDICLAVLKALACYRDEGRPVWALVFSIVRNKLVDRGRQQARRNESLCDDMTMHDVAHHDSPAELFEQDEAAAGVSAMLAALPTTQREVLTLRIIVGLSCIETAEAIGLTPGSVRVIQHRAMTALRRQLRVEEVAS